MKKDLILKELDAERPRSAWERGVVEYARDLLDYNRDEYPESWPELEPVLLNGAENWSEFSWGGCALICDEDIAERLCCPSELRRVNGGRWRPNRCEEWLDVQRRACYQAARLIFRKIRGLRLEGES